MKITDSHAHYDDSAFDSDRDALLERLFSGSTDKIINVGCSVKGSLASKALAEKYPKIWFSAGLHPDAADETDRIAEIEALVRHPKCVAVGETGLDYHYEEHSREMQRAAFEAQLEIAARADKPVIIHSRDACADTMELLRKYRPRGVMHCFSYTWETALEAVSLGMYIGFTGAITFKNAKKNRRALSEIPPDRVLVETDCPYMSPEPLRGRRSDSSMIEYTLNVFGEIMGITADEAARLTAENAARLFGI